MKVVFLALLSVVAGLQVSVRTRSPVEKVVELIQELKAKIEADGAIGQKTYDKFACWCETTTARKANNIDDGKATIASTTTEILTLKGAIAVLEHEISVLEERIAKNNAAMATLTKIREKENGDYQQEKGNMETAIGSLHQAIQVLSGAGTGGDMGLLTVAAKVRSAVQNSPHLSTLSVKESDLLKSFLEEPADYYDQKAQAKASYSPQSGTVTGILKNMYDTFAANLEKANSEESDLQKGYEDLMAEKEAQNKLDSETVTAKETEKAEKSKMLGDADAKLIATQEQLKLDEDFFATARDSCKAKSDEWDERARLRTEQLKGIHDALEILTSDEARATFQASDETRPVDTFGTEGVASFVQLDASAPRERAYAAIKKIAGGSLRMAYLAVNVRMAAMGHFDEVIASIDEMIAVLKSEGQDDIRQRDFCIEDRNRERNNRDDLQYSIEQLQAKIDRLNSKKKGLEKDVERVTKDKEDLIAAMAQALSDRTDENGNFHSAKDDDEAAIGLLGDAIAAMSKYSTNNLALSQQPTFDVSEDQAPDATFTGADKHAGATSGIVGLLQNIKEGLEQEVADATQSESNATEEFIQLKAESDKQIEAYDAELTSLTSAIADTDAAILETTDSKTDTEAEHESTLNYLDRVRGNCDWIEGAFTKRAAARTKESEGLGMAKSILAGAELIQEGGDFGFLQRLPQ